MRSHSDPREGTFDEGTIAFLSFTWLWNLCGAPALSVPWGLDGEGLPNSVQLVAAPGADPTAIAVAAATPVLTRPQSRSPSPAKDATVER
jgi:aspartyl-tRNA(Asn)/glutamyl-tRNA(Gln) amidotransferase subunit A